MVLLGVRPNSPAMLLLIWGVPAAAVLILAAKFANSLIRPLKALTKVADEISRGNLDVELDFGKKVRCWEIKSCQERDCPAYESEDLLCWFVDGTPCRDCPPIFPQKLEQCRQCFVYKEHKGDEVVQLADSLKHMLQQLKDSRAALERSIRLKDGILSQCFDGIIGADASAKVIIFNNQASRITSFPQNEVIGSMSIYDFFPLPFRETLKHWVEQGGPVPRELQPGQLSIINREGHLVPIRASFRLVETEEGHQGIFCFLMDLREIQRLQDEALRSHRQAIVGQITSSLSHYLRNILDGLRGGSYVINSAIGKRDWGLLRKGWEMMEDNVKRVDRLTTDLLHMAENPLDHVFLCDLNHLVEDAIEEVSAKINSAQVEMVKELSPTPLMAEMDPQAIRYAIYHLVLNAVEAAQEMDLERRKVWVRCWAQQGDHLYVQVRDMGKGINPIIRPKIFKEIFSTKGGSHLGLGLYVAARLIGAHGGEISLDSSESKGTTVTVRLGRRPRREAQEVTQHEGPSPGEDLFLFDSPH
jgi:PAS domain S-box-containing protein